MKKLTALILSTILVLTPAFAIDQSEGFYSSTYDNWTIQGTIGEEGEGKLINTSCYAILEQQPTRVLIGYDLVNEETFMLVHSKEWTNLTIDPPEDLKVAPEPNLYMDFYPMGLQGLLYSRNVAPDRISIRYIDPASFIPILMETKEIRIYSGNVPSISIDLPGVAEAVTMLNDCVVQARALAPKAVPEIETPLAKPTTEHNV